MFTLTVSLMIQERLPTTGNTQETSDVFIKVFPLRIRQSLYFIRTFRNGQELRILSSILSVTIYEKY